MNRIIVFFIAINIATNCEIAFAGSAGNWTSGSGQGIYEYTLRNGPGNSVVISCDEGFSEDHSKTQITVEIVGRSPPANSDVKFVVDGDLIQFGVNEIGEITTDCRVCSSNFSYFWTQLRKSRVLFVQFADGRSSKFNLVGASKILDKKPCATAF